MHARAFYVVQNLLKVSHSKTTKTPPEMSSRAVWFIAEACPADRQADRPDLLLKYYAVSHGVLNPVGRANPEELYWR
jgi:hypothetical protein